MEGDSRPRDSRESIKDAAERGKVSFSQVFAALYAQYDERLTDEERASRVATYEGARRAFEDAHDGVVRSYHANEFPAGVALTGDGQLHDAVWVNTLAFDTTDAAGFWSELRTLRDRVDLNLPSDQADRRICLRGVFDLFAGLITAMVREWELPHDDGRPPPNEQFDRALAQLRQERDDLERRYLDFVRAHAHHVYLAGALLGMVPVLVVIGITWLVLDWSGEDAWPWVPVMAAGALGAVLSVLQRMTSGTLAVQIEAERRDLRYGGMTRPAVGVLSALALYILVEADLVLSVPDDDATARFFFVAIAFFAGFSERFAKDAFGTAEGALPQASAPAQPRSRPGGPDARPRRRRPCRRGSCAAPSRARRGCGRWRPRAPAGRRRGAAPRARGSRARSRGGRLDHLPDRVAVAGAEVVDRVAAGLGGLERQHVGAAEVLDVDVVAHGGAVARRVVGAEDLHVVARRRRRRAGRAGSGASRDRGPRPGRRARPRR